MSALCQERWLVTVATTSTARLDCPAALRAIARGGYVINRVFFATSEDARAAGYRPCAVCLPGAYTTWKTQQDGVSETRPVRDARRQVSTRRRHPQNHG
ncbi:MAG TPA: Ada metal-binding domain-containing protein [Ktedonobacteraceae bacterium]|nr:Ada metal-binding domain-containing protein [Ktedonobacteraceae bacterium]